MINLVESLPKSRAYDVICHNLLKSATSVGASYREALRGESKVNSIHKIGIVEKEVRGIFDFGLRISNCEFGLSVC